MRRTVLFVLLVCGAVAGCSSRSGGTTGATQRAVAPVTPMRFRRMTAMMRAAQADRARGNADLLRRRSAALSNEGIALIRATLPHDVSRTDVPRYLEGRAVFGQALKGLVGAVESGSDPDLFRALELVDDALRGWIDAYTGMPPETSI